MPRQRTRLNGFARWQGVVATAAIGGVLAVLPGCSGDSDASRDGACAAPGTAPASEAALLPDGLSFDGIGTLTHVARAEGHISATAVTTKPLEEATVLVQDAVVAAGYRPAGMDNEGFEAEVFFTRGQLAAGQAIFRQGACEGRWDIELILIDPDLATPSPSSSPSSTSS